MKNKVSLFITTALIILVGSTIVLGEIQSTKSTSNLESNKTVVEESNKKSSQENTTQPDDGLEKASGQTKAATIQKTAPAVVADKKSSNPTKSQIPEVKTVSLKIDTGEDSYDYQVDWIEGMTVFEVLDEAHTKFNFSLKYTNYGSWGAFITQLHGVEGDWTYKVNGEAPSKGASVVTVNENDIITWKKV
ncbi:MAG: DUF4430 domain-containing protein [bacterium]|nr:DUF4430 domain-containing protein [bacterium]